MAYGGRLALAAPNGGAARCCAIVARPILSRRQHKAVVYPCSAR
jgi:hypothetical protein